MLGALQEMLASSVATAGYRERCEHAVAAIAPACGMVPEQEVERLRWCSERIDPAGEQACAGDLWATAAALTGISLPLLFELVLSFSPTRPPRFALLTQGRPAATASRTLANLLTAAVRIHLESGGAIGQAELLARVVRLAFPGMSTFDQYAPATQALLLGLVPAGGRTALKAYLNTRLDTTTPHTQRVTEILTECGVVDHGLYEALYVQTEGASFHGVGIDLDDAHGCRAKLYVHCQRQALAETLGRLAPRLAASGANSADADLQRTTEKFLAALAGPALLNRVELAVALHEDNPATMKLTAFFSPRRVSEDDVANVLAYVTAADYDVAPLRAGIAALAAGVDQPRIACTPMAAVGVEIPMGERAKINVYLQPVL